MMVDAALLVYLIYPYITLFEIINTTSMILVTVSLFVCNSLIKINKCILFPRQSLTSQRLHVFTCERCGLYLFKLLSPISLNPRPLDKLHIVTRHIANVPFHQCDGRGMFAD